MRGRGRPFGSRIQPREMSRLIAPLRGTAMIVRDFTGAIFGPTHRRLALLNVFIVGALLLSVLATPSFGQGVSIKEEGERLEKWRLGYGEEEVLSGATESVNINEDNYSGYLAGNYLGTDVVSGPSNYIVDTGKEFANFFQCMDFRIIPGCWCGFRVFGVCVPLFPAYEYRTPVSRYEVTRQPFQSDYWPTPIMAVFRGLNPNPGVSFLLTFLRMSVVKLAFAVRGVNIESPGKEVENVLKAAISTALQPSHNANDRGRGAAMTAGREASVNLQMSPLRLLSEVPGLSLMLVKTHINDGARLKFIPSWSADPVHFLLSRAPATSLFVMPFFNPIYAVMGMITQVLNLGGQIIGKINNLESTFSSSLKITTGMAGDIFPKTLDAVAQKAAETAVKKLGFKFPQLKLTLPSWFPFNLHLNTLSEPMAAVAAALRVGKSDCNILGYPDLYALGDTDGVGDDRMQYLRGDELGGFNCEYPELGFEEFGKANVLERPAKVITMSHWKRYSGCPPWTCIDGSCPFEKIDKQDKCNPNVKSRPDDKIKNASVPSWPWEKPS